MKGIILAGGRATRLYPVTKAVCKQLLPVYDKPMIYYSMSTLLLAGIRDILLISTPESLPSFKRLFGDGSSLGLNLTYQVQEKPNGIAQAFILGKKFISGQRTCLILGDNIFYGDRLSHVLKKAAQMKGKAVVFGYYVRDPGQYGVVSFNAKQKVISIEEKPAVPKSNYAVTGLYFYDGDVVKVAESLKPSGRDELEITDVNNVYLRQGRLNVQLLGRGYAWLDMGTCDSLSDASLFIKTMEERQGLKIGCLEEIAWREKFITDEKQLYALARQMPVNYREYLMRLPKVSRR